MIMSYNLRAVVDETLDANPGVELAVIAAKVAAEVPSCELRSVVAQLMPEFVEHMVRVRRSANPLLQQQKERSARSPKVRAIREFHERWLADLVKVDGEDKLLGDCTYDDLMAAAELRRKQARELNAKADSYERVADAVREHSVATVRELPASVLRELAGSAAA